MRPELVRLRAELYAAAQTLSREDAEEFWKLIEEIHELKPLRRLLFEKEEVG